MTNASSAARRAPGRTAPPRIGRTNRARTTPARLDLGLRRQKNQGHPVRRAGSRRAESAARYLPRTLSDREPARRRGTPGRHPLPLGYHLHQRQRRRAHYRSPATAISATPKKDLPLEARDKNIPAFLQAAEKSDLAHPGTIAHLRLKLDGLEPPTRVTLGAWPNEKLRVLDRQADGPSTLWNVPLLPLKSLELNDSAIVIYWPGPVAQTGNGKARGRLRVRPVDPRPQGGRLPRKPPWTALSPRRGIDCHRLREPGRGRQGPDRDSNLARPLQAPRRRPQSKHVPRLPNGVQAGNVPVTWKVQPGPTGASANSRSRPVRGRRKHCGWRFANRSFDVGPWPASGTPDPGK